VTSRADDESLREAYKLAVEMADRVSARRGSANTFFISLQSALVAVLALVTKDDKPPTVVVVALCCAGMAVAVAWFLQLRSYRDLKRAKFEVINDLEQQLQVPVFLPEWKALKKDKMRWWWRPRYAELSLVEQIIPAVFLVANVVLLAVLIQPTAP
jgi:hypothetical protein